MTSERTSGFPPDHQISRISAKDINVSRKVDIPIWRLFTENTSKNISKYQKFDFGT